MNEERVMSAIGNSYGMDLRQMDASGIHIGDVSHAPTDVGVDEEEQETWAWE